MMFSLVLRLVACLLMFGGIFLETGLSGQHTTECPWMCKCSGDKVFCDNLKIYLWPYDNTKIYRGYRFLDVPGNKIERLPGRSLKTNFPNLQQIDITGTNIPCQYVYCPKLNAVKVLSECKPDNHIFKNTSTVPTVATFKTSPKETVSSGKAVTPRFKDDDFLFTTTTFQSNRTLEVATNLTVTSVAVGLLLIFVIEKLLHRWRESIFAFSNGMLARFWGTESLPEQSTIWLKNIQPNITTEQATSGSERQSAQSTYQSNRMFISTLLAVLPHSCIDVVVNNNYQEPKQEELNANSAKDDIAVVTQVTPPENFALNGATSSAFRSSRALRTKPRRTSFYVNSQG